MTNPRGSIKQIFESLDTGSKDLKASPNDSEVDFAKPGAAFVTGPSFDAADLAVPGLKRPDQALGLLQAGAAGAAGLVSSVAGSA